MRRDVFGLSLLSWTGLMFSAACASAGGERSAHLPFRVAVAPVQITYVGVDAEAAASRQDADVLRIHFDAGQVGRSIANVLRRRVFADAVNVDASTSAKEGESRDDEWVRLAGELDANLLLECELRITPDVVTATNDRFWMNLVLFAIGGPVSWFVPDRSYHFDAQVFAHLHQIEPLRDGVASLADRRACLAYSHAQVNEVELNLFKRTGGSVIPLMASVVVPAGFLVPVGGNVRKALEQQVVEQLADELGRQMVELRHQIVEGGLVTDIGLEGVEVRRQEDALWLHGTALLRSGTSNRLAGYSLRMGQTHIEKVFGKPEANEGTGRPEVLRYPIMVKLPEDARRLADTCLEVELMAGGRDRARRSFCVRLDW